MSISVKKKYQTNLQNWQSIQEPFLYENWYYQQTGNRHRYKLLLTTGRAVEYGRDRWEALLPRRPRRVEVSSSSSPSPRSTSPRCITCQVKEKQIFFSLRNISHYNSLKIQTIYYLTLGTCERPAAGTTGWWRAGAARRSAPWSLVPRSRATGARASSRAGQQRSRSPETAGDGGSRRSSRSPQVGSEGRAYSGTGAKTRKKN
jgi:hypothetical protein